MISFFSIRRSLHFNQWSSVFALAFAAVVVVAALVDVVVAFAAVVVVGIACCR